MNRPAVILMSIALALLGVWMSVALFPLLLMLLLAGFWVTQILDLMHRRDDEFPGRSDKLIWALVIILLPGLGAFAYWLWKPLLPVASPESLRREFTGIKTPQPAPPDEPGSMP